jgi:hypothetical protein
MPEVDFPPVGSPVFPSPAKWADLLPADLEVEDRETNHDAIAREPLTLWNGPPISDVTRLLYRED